MKYRMIGKAIFAIEDDNTLTKVTEYSGHSNLISQIKKPLKEHKDKKDKEDKDKKDKEPKVKTADINIPKKRGRKKKDAI